MNGREPTDEELSNILGISVNKLDSIVNCARQVDSLDREIDDEEQTSLSNFIPDTNPGPEEENEKKLLKQDIENLLDNVDLTEQQKCVIKYRFGLTGIEPMTLEQIANIYGVSRERIRQVIETTLRKIRNSPYSKVLEVYINGNISDITLKKKKKNTNEKEGNLMSNCKRFFDIFSNYTTVEVQAAVDKLPQEYKEIIYLKYGKDLTEYNSTWTERERSLFYTVIKKLINTLLVNPDYKYDNSKKRHLKDKRLFDRIKGYDEKVVRQAVDALSLEYKEIIAHKFGQDLEEIFFVPDEERIKLNNVIIPTIKNNCKLISRGKEVNLSKNKKIVQESAISVDSGTVDILGTPMSYENLNVESDNITNGSTDNIINNNEESISSIITDNGKNEVENCKHLEYIVSSPEFKEFVRTLNIVDISIASLAFGYINDYYDIDSIADFLNMKRETIEKGIKDILSLYKEHINKQLDEAISTPIQKQLALKQNI